MNSKLLASVIRKKKKYIIFKIKKTPKLGPLSKI